MIDSDKLIPYDKETHLDFKFRRESDLIILYDDRILFHLEFPMRKEPYIPIRIFNYKYAAMQKQTKADKQIRLLYLVYSLTLYMGESPWNKHKQLYEFIKTYP